MSLYRKTPNGPWYYDFWVEKERYRGSTGLKDYDRAKDIEVDLQQKEREKARRQELGLKPIPEPEPEPEPLTTVGEVLDGLLDYYKLNGKASVKNLSLIKRVKRDLGSTVASHLNKAAVLRYLAKRQSEPKGAANSTLNHVVTVLASAFAVADLKFPKIKKLSEKSAVRSGYFSDDEFRRIYRHLPEDLRDFCLFGYISGWRKGAISTLTWDSVSNGNVYLKAMHSKNGLPYFVPVIPGSELDELLKRRKAARLVDGTLSNLVFHRDGRPVAEMRKSWATACKAAGVPGRLFHDLRRTAARNLRESGVAESIAMRIIGAATASIYKRYAIVAEDELRDAMRKREQHQTAERGKVVAIG